MKLTKQTIDLLKNFANINKSIVINPGNELYTIAEAKNIIGQAQVEETFESTIGIYDLVEFLSVLSMFKEPDLIIDEKKITIKENKRKIVYYLASPSLLNASSGKLTVPDFDLSFTLSQQEINDIKKASQTLQAPDLIITKDSLEVTDSENRTSNNFVLEKEIDCSDMESDDFKIILKVSYLKMIAGDYKVNISTKLIAEFVQEGDNNDVVYYVAVEKTSEV